LLAHLITVTIRIGGFRGKIVFRTRYSPPHWVLLVTTKVKMSEVERKMGISYHI
jgi:hypothetical protein